MIQEVKENNKRGNEFDLAKSINAQLPFFSCKNAIFDKNIQKDIQRYVYCKDNNVPPYSGDYDNQPAVWVDRYFAIKNAFAKREQGVIEKSKKEIK